MKVACRHCSAEIPANHVHAEQRVARCVACNTIFDISAQGESGSSTQLAPVRRERVAMPKAITIVQSVLSAVAEKPYREAARLPEPEFVIVRRWSTAPFVFGAAVFVFFTGLLWFRVFFADSIVGALLMLPFAVALSYVVLALLINRTTIRARDGRLTISIGPLPWSGNKTILMSDLRQLYCRQIVTEGDPGSSVSYEVVALLANGTTTRLVRGLLEADQALFLEQAIEERLGIIDEPVAGELDRSSSA